MARMYSRKKGKSGSTKPVKKTVPGWVRYKSNEIESLISKMAKEGMPASLIGLHLRDSYGVPNVKLITGKSITKILEDKKLSPELPEDMSVLIKKAVFIRKHLENNHKDQPARRGLTITEAKIKKLAKYYQVNKRIPVEWKYDPERVKLFVE